MLNYSGPRAPVRRRRAEPDRAAARVPGGRGRCVDVGGGRRRVLATAAAPVLAHARDVVARTVDLARYTHYLREGRGGSLRVGMIDAAAVEHFSHTLRHFRAHRPDLDLRLTVTSSAALLELLRRAELDVVVLGWTVLPPVSARRPAASPAVGQPIADRRLVVARRAEAVRNPAGEALERALHQAVEGEPARRLTTPAAPTIGRP